MKPAMRLWLFVPFALVIVALVVVDRVEGQGRPPGTFGGGVAGAGGRMPGAGGGPMIVWRCVRCNQVVGTGPIRPTGGSHICPNSGRLGNGNIGGGAGNLPPAPVTPPMNQPGAGINQPAPIVPPNNFNPPRTGIPPVAPPPNTMRDDIEKAGRTTSGLMIAAGIGVSCFGLLILGGVGFLIYQSQRTASSSPPPRRRRRSRDDYDD